MNQDCHKEAVVTLLNLREKYGQSFYCQCRLYGSQEYSSFCTPVTRFSRRWAKAHCQLTSLIRSMLREDPDLYDWDPPRCLDGAPSSASWWSAESLCQPLHSSEQRGRTDWTIGLWSLSSHFSFKEYGIPGIFDNQSRLFSNISLFYVSIIIMKMNNSGQ